MNIQVETITPEKAATYLTRNVNNRRVSEAQVTLYAADMRAGKWELNGDAVRFDKDGHLLDGQHRLIACTRAGVPFQAIVVSDIDGKVMPTIDNGKSRNAGDVFTISGIKNARSLASITRKFIFLSRRNSIIKTYGSTSGNRKISNGDVLDVYERYMPIMRESLRVAERCYNNCKAFSRNDIGAVYAYLRIIRQHREDEVTDFFEQLTDVKTASLNVLRLCRKLYVNDNCSSVHMTSANKQRYLIKTWNMYCTGKDVQILKLFETDKNIWFL